MNAGLGSGLGLAALALGAIALWPFSSARTVDANVALPVPVSADYAVRDRTIAFYEQRVRRDSADQISARLLAAQYMQRYRETADVGDIVRARAQAMRSLRLQPQNNAPALETVASADTALHRFREALQYEYRARREQPGDTNALAQIASLHMELGEYTAAERAVRLLANLEPTPTTLSVRARYDELTGRLDEARALLTSAMHQADSLIDEPAQSRAWFHYRRGEIAFMAGDLGSARRDERDALAEFPRFELASRALARFCWAAADWSCALDAAKNAADVVPLPESLGYEADAQRSLGDASSAAQTQSLIVAIERIGNAYRLNDRLLSVYYAEHGIRLPQALAIAQREVAVRGNEIYAQDTLAWAAAMNGRWNLARDASQRALRLGTKDPRILYHAGVIASHFGNGDAARRYFTEALAQNARFHPSYAQDARERLAKL